MVTLGRGRIERVSNYCLGLMLIELSIGAISSGG